MPDAGPDQYVLVERTAPGAMVTLNRPEKLNALSWALMSELADKLEALDGDEAIRCIVLTGAGDKAFAAGADIGEMSGKGAIGMASPTGTEAWDRIRRIRTPLIAAVGGYALGGGDELALRCDLIVASENARFGQPEIALGVMPGGGGTQLLALAIGKCRALELCLTGGARHRQVPRVGALPHGPPRHGAGDVRLGRGQPCGPAGAAPQPGV